MSNAAPEPKENMGKPEPRIDGRLKVTGEARYGSDFPVADPAYAFLVTSAMSGPGVTASTREIAMKARKRELTRSS